MAKTSNVLKNIEKQTPKVQQTQSRIKKEKKENCP